MKKLFNKKIMVLYIVLLCIAFISGIVSAGFCASYSSQIEKIQKENKAGLTGILTDALTSALTGVSGENSSAANTQDEKANISEEEKALQKNKTVSIVMMIVLFVLGTLFSAAAITSYQYEKYLQSDKYKAKLKRLKKYEKYQKTVKG